MPTRRTAILSTTAMIAGSTALSGAARSQAPNTPSHLQNAPTGPFATQDWGEARRLDAEGLYALERVVYQSQGADVVGNLFVPAGGERKPALVLIGPVAFVKEQAPVQYASRLARAGYVSLVFDPRFHGESGGEPRRFENGRAKTDDLKASIDYLLSRPEVDPARVFVVGICQGVNWAIQAAIEDRRVRALTIIAGNYLTPTFAELYLGSKEQVAERLARGAAAKERFERSGQVDYIPIVSESDPSALLPPRVIHQFYTRWADRGAFWNFHGLWENRITAMSQVEVFGGRTQETIKGLRTPTLMVHANRAANGPSEPRQLFESIPAERKRLVWLGNENQMQFYEDPVTIDRVVPHVARFFREQVAAAEPVPSTGSVERG